jgi:hypothetical protein
MANVRASPHAKPSERQPLSVITRKSVALGVLREGTPTHLYPPSRHRGVSNEEALAASKETVLCESIIDALTFWCTPA